MYVGIARAYGVIQGDVLLTPEEAGIDVYHAFGGELAFRRDEVLAVTPSVILTEMRTALDFHARAVQDPSTVPTEAESNANFRVILALRDHCGIRLGDGT